MSRKDLSDSLIHFTKDENYELAFKGLQKITEERCLLGTNTFIRGGYDCVCFSEAPLECSKTGLANLDYYYNYSLFGIMLTKKYPFEK